MDGSQHDNGVLDRVSALLDVSRQDQDEANNELNGPDEGSQGFMPMPPDPLEAPGGSDLLRNMHSDSTSNDRSDTSDSTVMPPPPRRIAPLRAHDEHDDDEIISDREILHLAEAFHPD